MFNLYTSKLNKKCDRLWQRPRQGYVHYNDEEWFEARPVGHDPIERFMKFLSKNAKLAGENYTNHSIRATVIGTLDSKGFEARHITAISSHKNETTIKTYAKKCPEQKKRQMYDALNETLVPKRRKLPCSTVSKPSENTSDKQALPTIDIQEVQKLTSPSNTNNNNNENLPPEFELKLFEDDETDDFLMEYLRSNPIDPTTTAPINTSTTTTMASKTNSIPIMPKMLFQNSNVTINYNFHK